LLYNLISLEILILKKEAKMTTSTTVAMPSIWLQEKFFEVAQNERGRNIGERPVADLGLQLPLRVTAAAHAVFQLLCGLALTIPVSVVASCQAASRPEAAGILSKKESTVVRVAAAVYATFAALYLPVVSSIKLMINPEDLDNTDSFAVQGPIIGHAFLLAASLPPLPQLGLQTTDGLATKAQNWTASKFGNRVGSLTGKVVAALGSTVTEAVDLQQTDQDVQWRAKLPIAIAQVAKDRPTSYHRAFNTSSTEFLQALGSIALS
jgi:hypothetical protein